jgi:septation ring formation regulator EzrA
MSDETEPERLTNIVDRFIRADEALESILDERLRLTTATSDLTLARTDMEQRTSTSVEALEQIRAELRERMEQEAKYREDVSQYEGTLGDVLAEVSLTLQRLRSIDPEQFARELAELRRDGGDNAAELREVRRTAGELQREQLTFRTALGNSTDLIEVRLDAIDAALRDTNARVLAGETADGERHRQLLDMTAKLRKVTLTVAAASVVGLIASIISIFV